MDGRVILLGGLFGLLVVLVALFQPLLPTREQATVSIHAASTETTAKAVIDARVADTPYERYRGLSGEPALAPDTGLLFCFPIESNKTMVMRGMEFGLDIVFIDADQTITAIHHAPPPTETETRQQYQGTAKYVLELPRGYTDEHDITVGDHVTITYETPPADTPFHSTTHASEAA